MIHEMLHGLIKVWFGWVESWGYLGVFILMAMESSIIPVPSEIVMPPAAFWAAQGRMSFAGVVFAGTAGSYAGSIVSYWVARWVGTPVIARYGHFVGITPEKLKFAEAWVQKYGATGIFLARLLPVVRHLISIPAGILKMPVAKFSVVTTAGAGVWCLVLSWFGREVIGAHPELLQSPEAMIGVMKAKLIWLVAGVAVFFALYVAVLWQKKRSGQAVVAALCLALVTLAPAPARADEVYTFVVKKQEEKAKTRWSLSDWLETRDRMRLMDLWLALHSPTPYEFFLNGAYIIPSQTGAQSGFDLGAAAFASIFGLEVRRESVPQTRIQGMFDLRIFGYHDQSTNITLQAGLQSQTVGAETFRGALGGARMDIYIARYFGIGGLYRHYFDSTGTSVGVFGGSRYEGQAFIDFKFLRLYGVYYSESSSVTAASVTTDSPASKGVSLGAKLYF